MSPSMSSALVLLLTIVLKCSLTISAEVPKGCATTDLKRAKQRIPRAGWKGDSFARMATLLTSKLSGSGFRIRPCGEWTVTNLQHLQRQLFNESEKELLAIYDQANDNRRQRFRSLSALEAHWAEIDAAAAADNSVHVRRDGLCHETVMWAVHQLPVATLHKLHVQGLELPSLPTIRHHATSTAELLSRPTREAHRVVHAEYEQQVSCQQCHTGTIVDPSWQNASLPGVQDLIPSEKEHPALDRLRRCNFRMSPCGPCDGLGGKRWGDGAEDFTPMKCEAIHGPEVPATTRGCYPQLGSAGLTGETRAPLEVFPTGKKGEYPPLNGTISMGDEGNVMRLRYDFGSMGGEITAQTLEQAKKMDTGATIGMFGSTCECSKSIAGNFHACSFENDPLDEPKLPGNEGGAAYLGRVRVTLDGDVPSSQREAIADHFMKWAFHFLVDADDKSPSFGLPLRLYGAGGVRMVYDNWKVGDPAVARPDIWSLPKNCNVTAPECSVFKPALSIVDESPAVVV